MKTWTRLSAVALLALFAPAAAAGVALGGTRVIYPGGDKEVTVPVLNESDRPALVQAWLDNGHDRQLAPERIEVPFTVLPPLLRIEAKGRQTLRIARTEQPLPTDRESLFWLNVLDVPAKTANASPDTLRIAVRIRVKLIHRPHGLAGSAAQAPAQARWSLRGDGERAYVNVDNPTPYYINFSEVAVLAAGQRSVTESDYVAPFSSAQFTLPASFKATAGEVQASYRWINDLGGEVSGTTPISTAAAAR